MQVGLLEHVIASGPVSALVPGLRPPHASQRCSRPVTKHIRWVCHPSTSGWSVSTQYPRCHTGYRQRRMRPRLVCPTRRFQTHTTTLCDAWLRLRAISAHQDACEVREGRGRADMGFFGPTPGFCSSSARFRDEDTPRRSVNTTYGTVRHSAR